MTRSPRALNAAQYDENCQNWPKLAFKRPAMAIFFRILKTTDSIFEISISNCIRKNAGSRTLKQKAKKGVTLVRRRNPAGQAARTVVSPGFRARPTLGALVVLKCYSLLRKKSSINSVCSRESHITHFQVHLANTNL